MKKTIQISIAVLFLLGATVVPAAAKGRVIVIPAGFVSGVHFGVVQGESIPALGFSYYASSELLVAEFIECVGFSVTFVDKEGNVVLKLSPEVVRQLWTEPTPVISGYLFASTGTERSSYSRAHWSIVMPELSYGDYEVHTVLQFAHALTSGCDKDGDGKPDMYLPDDYNMEYVVYLHVRAPDSLGGGLPNMTY